MRVYSRFLITRTPIKARPIPAKAAEQERRTLSVSNWRHTLALLAPTAMRTETSRWRDDARASNRFATLPQAINSTHVTAPNNSINTGRISPVIESRNFMATAPTPALFFGYAEASDFASAASSALAWESRTPLRRRPRAEYW